jgi:hypothetical protein
MSETSTGHHHEAELHGLLQKVRDLGLPLLSVTQVDADQPDLPKNAPR